MKYINNNSYDKIGYDKIDKIIVLEMMNHFFQN